MNQVPSSIPFTDLSGNLNPAWQSFFQQFTQAPPGASSLVITASPFAYVAREPGLIAVVGGTVASVTLTRGTLNIDVSGEKLIAVSVKDTITVTYSVLPIIQFLPNFGNANAR